MKVLNIAFVATTTFAAIVTAHDESLRGAKSAFDSAGDSVYLESDVQVQVADNDNDAVDPNAQWMKDNNGTEAGSLVWAPGEEAEPMSEDELEEVMSLLPHNSILKNMSTKPGKGLGRNNLNALVNSGKPFLLNGLDDELRADLEDVMKLKLNDENQPFVIVIPTRVKGKITFHFIEAEAPLYDQIKGETVTEKRHLFLAKFLKMADEANAKVEQDHQRKLLATDAAVPNRSYTHTKGPFSWDWLVGDPTENRGKLSEFWETAYIEYFKTSNGHDIEVIHEGNWNSNYQWDDRNTVRGWANGHSTVKITPPSGYGIREYTPKNINNEQDVSETTGFELSGTAECASTGECTAGIGASYSQERTISYTIKDWEILANGYGQWDFKQASPFRVYESPMTDQSECYWGDGGCLQRPPALSRGTASFKTATIMTGSNTGWQWVAFQNTGRSFRYSDKGAWSWDWTYYTLESNSGINVYVG